MITEQQGSNRAQQTVIALEASAVDRAVDAVDSLDAVDTVDAVGDIQPKIDIKDLAFIDYGTVKRIKDKNGKLVNYQTMKKQYDHGRWNELQENILGVLSLRANMDSIPQLTSSSLHYLVLLLENKWARCGLAENPYISNDIIYSLLYDHEALVVESVIATHYKVIPTSEIDKACLKYELAPALTFKLPHSIQTWQDMTVKVTPALLYPLSYVLVSNLTVPSFVLSSLIKLYITNARSLPSNTLSPLFSHPCLEVHDIRDIIDFTDNTVILDTMSIILNNLGKHAECMDYAIEKIRALKKGKA